LILYFESHATSIDNDAGIASGHADAPLSPLGLRQAAEMTARYRTLSQVWCSDLERSWRTAEIAFGGRAPVMRDARLREVDFGDMTRTSAAAIEPARDAYVTTPYPRGESYEDVCHRIREFLEDMVDSAEPQLIVGHRATWYALEHLLACRNLTDVVTAPWRWQPGWRYDL
jgi:broad specificity phosphatase PhoE